MTCARGQMGVRAQIMVAYVTGRVKSGGRCTPNPRSNPYSIIWTEADAALIFRRSELQGSTTGHEF